MWSHLDKHDSKADDAMGAEHAAGGALANEVYKAYQESHTGKYDTLPRNLFLKTNDVLSVDETGEKLTLLHDGNVSEGSVSVNMDGKLHVNLKVPYESTIDPKTGDATFRITEGPSAGDEVVYHKDGSLTERRKDDYLDIPPLPGFNDGRSSGRR